MTTDPAHKAPQPTINVSLMRTLRLSRGWTASDLAHQAGIANSTMSRIENDEVIPRPSTVSRLAFALNIDVLDLYEGVANGRRAETVGRSGR